MSTRKVNFVSNEYYHIYNRGNDKRVIFHDNQDYHRFVNLMYLSNTKINFRMNDISKNVYTFDRGKRLVEVGAYCIMPNHFHLILTQKEENGISKFMQKLSTGYSMYYNQKYQRTGSLFQGKFKSQHVSNDRYLKYLFSYVHLNPVKITKKDWKEKGIGDKGKAIEFLNSYKYSSYLDYIGEIRNERNILNKEAFPSYFPTKAKFIKEIFEWLSFKQ